MTTFAAQTADEVDLRELLEHAPHTDPTPAAVAGPHAAFVLGREIAELITWRAAWEDDETLLGEIPTGAEAEATVVLRYTQAEPGSESLEAAVPCPVVLGCGPAWQTVDGRTDLRGVLDGDYQERWCDQHGNGEDAPL